MNNEANGSASAEAATKSNYQSDWYKYESEDSREFSFKKEQRTGTRKGDKSPHTWESLAVRNRVFLNTNKTNPKAPDFKNDQDVAGWMYTAKSGVQYVDMSFYVPTLECLAALKNIYGKDAVVAMLEEV